MVRLGWRQSSGCGFPDGEHMGQLPREMVPLNHAFLFNHSQILQPDAPCSFIYKKTRKEKVRVLFVLQQI